MTVEQLYESAIRSLPMDEQIHLARYIVWKCSTDGPVEYSDEWSDEDLRVYRAYSYAMFELRELEDSAKTRA